MLLSYLLARCQEFFSLGAKRRGQPGASVRVIWLAGAVAVVGPPPVPGSFQQELVAGGGGEHRWETSLGCLTGRTGGDPQSSQVEPARQPASPPQPTAENSPQPNTPGHHITGAKDRG